jgi:hypothetical protein
MRLLEARETASSTPDPEGAQASRVPQSLPSELLVNTIPKTQECAGMTPEAPLGADEFRRSCQSPPRTIRRASREEPLRWRGI